MAGARRGPRRDAENEFLGRQMGPRRGPVSLRHPFQSVDRSQQDHRQDDLSFRHRHASHRRPHAGGERLGQCGVRHHGLDRRVRGLHQARERDGRSSRRTISPISATSISPIARLLPELDIATMFHAGEYIGANTTSPEYGGVDDLGVARILLERMRPGGRFAVLHRLVRVRQSRCARARAGRREASSSASECSSRCWCAGRSADRRTSAAHFTSSGSVPAGLPASSVIFSTRASA